MSTERQRDAETDRLLRATLQPGVHAEPCPDADMLAAYAERTLSPAERDTLDVHFADCHRCQEALAFIARAWAVPDTVQPSTSRRWWSLPMKWVVPVAAAAVVVMYVAVRPVIAPYFPQTGLPSEEGQSPAPEHVMADARLQEREAIPTGADSRLAVRDAPRGASDTKSATRAREKAAGMPAAAESPKLPTIAVNEARPDSPAQTALAVAAPAARAEAADVPRQQFAMKASASPPRDVVSPDGSAMWRLAPGGRVLRSGDRGMSWQAQSSGVSEELLAGSAVSATVCWIVGRAATVILTTDGARWTPRPFPERLDLVAVEAADARSATVTTRDGRRYATLDGGVTWSAK